ncbi:MAG: CidA/LrgA family protein [Cellulosilyticaceae bacterium]
MAFFFIPAGVTIMENYEFLKGSILQLLIICVVTMILTFAATAYTVKAVIMLQNKRRKVDEWDCHRCSRDYYGYLFIVYINYLH